MSRMAVANYEFTSLASLDLHVHTATPTQISRAKLIDKMDTIKWKRRRCTVFDPDENLIFDLHLF